LDENNQAEVCEIIINSLGVDLRLKQSEVKFPTQNPQIVIDASVKITFEIDINGQKEIITYKKGYHRSDAGNILVIAFIQIFLKKITDPSSYQLYQI
jgi:hypothetical protein